MREECGVMGIFADHGIARDIFLGLYSLQHRGQESGGIVTFKKEADQPVEVFQHKQPGLVSDIFQQSDLDRLQGDCGVGHVRYSTSEPFKTENIQPFSFKTYRFGQLAVAHNGNLTNANDLRKRLEATGSVFTTSSDSEIFIHLLAQSKALSLPLAIKDVMSQVFGAYSLVILSEDALYGVRDRFGFRPLVLGKKGQEWVLASETCSLDLLDAEYIRSVEAGEVLRLSKEGCQSFYPFGKSSETRFCSFESIYFARPDSKIGDESFYEVRKRMGKKLAEESEVQADLVIPVPDSGVPMALGYAEAAQIPVELGLVRNHYVGRTFIEPVQAVRDFRVKLKLNPISSLIKGKSIVVIDDSLVRGTTITKIIRLLRDKEPKAIHVRISSPPITHSCFYGVSTPTRDRLLAAQKDVAGIQTMLEVESLKYLSKEGLKAVLGDTDEQRPTSCYSCFTGKYPEPV